MESVNDHSNDIDSFRNREDRKPWDEILPDLQLQVVQL